MFSDHHRKEKRVVNNLRQKLLITGLTLMNFLQGVAGQQKSAVPKIAAALNKLEPKIHLGFKVNPTFGYTDVLDNPLIKSDGLKLGFSLGLTGDYLFQKNFALGAQLNVTTVNGGINISLPQSASGSTSGNQNTRIIYAVRYLELPLSVKARTNTIGDGSRFYFKAGLDPAFKISARGTRNVTFNGVVNILGNVQVEDQLKALRTSVLIGAGYDYSFSKKLTFTSGLEFNQGLNNISTDNTRSLKNSYLAIEFGVYF